MPRRKKKEEHLIHVALAAGWGFSAGVATVALWVGLVILPMFARGSLLLSSLLPAGRLFFLLAAAGFGAIALVKLSTRTERSTPSSAASSLDSFPLKAQPRRGAQPAKPTLGMQASEPFKPIDPIQSEPATWSLALLQSLDWKRFEEIVAAYFQEKNFKSEVCGNGADGGVDVRLFFGDMKAPVGIVQCKAWGKKQVGVAPVRELLGVMAHEKVARGYFAATGRFSDDAIAFAKQNPITLISGTDFLAAIAGMEAANSARLLATCITGDYTTPSCPSCGDKLHRMTFKTGKTAWVCKRYPACKTRIPANKAATRN